VRRTAAERNNEITTIVFEHFQAIVNVSCCGVRLGAVINNKSYAYFVQNCRNFVNKFNLNQNFVRNNKRLFKSHWFDIIGNVFETLHP